MVELLARRVASEPDSVAVETLNGHAMTFTEWWERSGTVAKALAARTTRRRPVLLGEFHRGAVDRAVAYFGVLRAGCVAVLPPADATAASLSRLREQFQAIAAIGDDLASSDSLSGLEREGAAQIVSLPDIQPSSPADIQFSSGTTAEPRPVITRHETLCAAYSSELLESQPTAGDLILSPLPLSTTFGHTVFLDMLQYPGSRLLAGPFEPKSFLAACREREPTITFLVPAMVRAIGGATGADDSFESLDLVCIAGSAVTDHLLRQARTMFPKATLVSSYCSTESWPAGTDEVFGSESTPTAGRPWEGREMRVVDAHGSVVPAGVQGQIELRSRGIQPRQRLELDRLAPIPVKRGGWVATDDYGLLDEGGRLHVRGRGSDFADVGGVQVELCAVEREVAELVGRPAAAYVIRHAVLGQIVGVIVEGHEPIDRPAVLTELHRRLGQAATPRSLERGTIPRSADGSVRRDELARTPRAALASPIGMTALEVTIAALWTEVLDGAPVGAGTNFFCAGGHSLTAIEVCERLEHEHGTAVSPQVLFTHPSLREFSAVVQEAGGLRLEVSGEVSA